VRSKTRPGRSCRQLQHGGDSLLTALRHDVGRTERPRERLPAGVPGHGHDAVGTEPPGREDRAQPDRSVADDDDGRALPHAGRDGRVVPGPQHVGEREQARDELVVGEGRGRDEVRVGERGTHQLALRAVDEQALMVLVPPHDPVHAGGREAVPAVRAGPVAERERCDHEVAGPHRAHVGADGLDHPDQLVTDPPWVRRRPDPAVAPQVGAAHARGHHAQEGIGRAVQDGVRHPLEADVVRTVEDGGTHGRQATWRTRSPLPPDGGLPAVCLAGGVTHVNDPAVVRRLLATPARWAVVGLSTNRSRAAHGVARYLQDTLGMTIVPIHPAAETVHGQEGYAHLADVPVGIDVVDVFVNSTRAGAVVDAAIAVGAHAVWLQLGVIDEAAADRARAAGLDVVMDTCPVIEGPRLRLG